MKMSDILFIHSPNLHEAHRMFAESINADFEPAYTKELTDFRRFIAAFKRAKEYPDYHIYLLEGGMPMFSVLEEESKESIRDKRRRYERSHIKE